MATSGGNLSNCERSLRVSPNLAWGNIWQRKRYKLVLTIVKASSDLLASQQRKCDCAWSAWHSWRFSSRRKVIGREKTWENGSLLFYVASVELCRDAGLLRLPCHRDGDYALLSELCTHRAAFRAASLHRVGRHCQPPLVVSGTLHVSGV
jgi:hypothetical protein